MLQYKNIAWWYWLGTIPLIAAALAGWGDGYVLAINLTCVQLIHFAVRTRSLTSFPCQVRVAYLELLLLGLWEPFAFIHWVQLFSTCTMLMFGYCPLARLLSLMPWNRREPFSLSLVARTLLDPPHAGSVIQGLGIDSDPHEVPWSCDCP
jgi:hypothetical protein